MSITIREAMTDPNLFGKQFGGSSWHYWRSLFAGFDGLELNKDEAKAFKLLTGRTRAPKGAANELYLAVGRRGGKTNTAAAVAVYQAAFNDFSDRLAPGEVATVMLLAADRKQARSCFRYISGLIHGNPMLERMIIREDKESIELSNRTAIEVHTASFRSVRGYSIACAICDEVAFWRSEDSANPDHEIINALRPAMATLDGRLVVLSSPHSKRGVLWEAYKNHYGKNDDSIVVAKAPSLLMNPSLPKKLIDDAYKRDQVAAASEYGAEFRSDLESYISSEVIDDVTFRKRYELAPVAGVRYTAFTDPAGGSGKDSITLAISHKDGETSVLDLVRSVKPPFSPEQVISEFSDLCKRYRCSQVIGDRYAGEYPRELFRKNGIHYKVSDRVRSEIYRDLLPLINSGKVELLDNKKLHQELCNLERRTTRSGRETIDHPNHGNAHDDLANAVAGSLVNTTKAPRFIFDCGSAPNTAESNRPVRGWGIADRDNSARLFDVGLDSGQLF